MHCTSREAAGAGSRVGRRARATAAPLLSAAVLALVGLGSALLPYVSGAGGPDRLPQPLVGAVAQEAEHAARLEANTGYRLGVRRTYWGPDQVDSAVAAVQDDHEAGRVPWVSFKLPLPWSAMAAGQGDQWARMIGDRLASTSLPVWVAFHHEPEGDGSPVEWVRMQQRLESVLDEFPTLGFTAILTGWHQLVANGGRGTPGMTLEDYWPGDGVLDVLGIDPYNFYGATDKDAQHPWLELEQVYEPLAAWLSGHPGTQWAVAETGYTDAAAALDPEWLIRAVRDLKRHGGIAFVYYDSRLNAHPSWTWTLDAPVKADQFRRTLALSGAGRLAGPKR